MRHCLYTLKTFVSSDVLMNIAPVNVLWYYDKWSGYTRIYDKNNILLFVLNCDRFYNVLKWVYNYVIFFFDIYHKYYKVIHFNSL